MKSEFLCEVCGHSDYRVVGTREYIRPITASSSSYRQKRLRVLFEVWFPGAETVRFNACMCGRCGFVSYVPRVESRDIEAKYRALEELGQDYGTEESEAVAAKRGEVIYSAVRRVTRNRLALRVLDYGGGDGRLMGSFVANGHDAYLVDYNVRPVRGVTKLGDNINDLRPNDTFDVIVANHVLEHVAQPTSLLRRLASHLRDSGCLFVEVPMEIWARAPLPDEPVTHVNFFVEGSLKRALEESGLGVLSSRLTRSLHPTGRFKLAVRALAQRTADQSASRTTGRSETQRYLQPSSFLRFRRRMLLAGGATNLMSAVIRRATSFGP